MRPDVCRHGSLRRQCEPCDLEEELDTMTRLARRLFANTKHFADCICITCEDARAFLATRTTPPGEAMPCKLDVDECAEEHGGEDCGAHGDAPGEPTASPATTQTGPTCGECGKKLNPTAQVILEPSDWMDCLSCNGTGRSPTALPGKER